MDRKLQTFLELGEELTILYVEDSEMVRESTCDILDEYFDNIDVAVNGEEGLQKYKEFYEAHNTFYDIVITDINMPKMNGIEMLESIFKLHTRANVIVMSAHNEAEYLLKLINMGISNFILKPIEITMFQTVVSRTIQSVVNQKKLKHYHTKMEEMNLELHKAKEIAENASEQKSLFLANMSHEIRTPLNAITGFISLLNEEERDPKKLKYLQVVKNASDSLLQIISDILDISKIENGKLEIEPANFNPYEDLITVAELFQVKAAEKGVVLKIQYNNNMPKTLFCDVLRIRQIFSNLLSNAIKFTPKGLSVKCIIWYAKGRLNISVKDYGVGIPKEKQSSIFNAFYQVKGTTQEHGGTGLGLAISRELATMLEGELTFISEEGKGSTFKLSIVMPIGEEPQKELDADEVEKAKLSGHILLVEDYEANRMFVGIILDNAGITYETANNGVEAVEKFKNGRYDLILMDENMPELGGIGATKAIIQTEKERGQKHTPIISLTANALKGDRERFLQAGMDDYISKPVEPDKLLSVLRSFLEADLAKQ
ncbi:MAG: response regulator [Sulfurimonadaceae bacterium]